MCLLCVEVAKGNMTVPEIRHAYIELRMDQQHKAEFFKLLLTKNWLKEFFYDIIDEDEE